MSRRRGRYLGESPEWKETVLGQEIQMRFSPGRGDFWATVGGETVHATSYETLIPAVQKEIRKQRVKFSVPVTLVGVTLHKSDGSGWRRTKSHISRHGDQSLDAEIVSRHASRGCAIAKADDVRFDVDRFDDFVLRRLNAKERAEWAKLHKAHKAAERALEAFLKPRKINISDAIDKAIADRLDTPDERDVDESEDPR